MRYRMVKCAIYFGEYDAVSPQMAFVQQPKGQP
jgi:hypothetical protein